MPELPEIETICNTLINGNDRQPPVVGKTIVGAQVLWERTLSTPLVEEFLARIRRQSIQGIGRRGKYLVFELSNDYLIFHLRMSGDIMVEKNNLELSSHSRLVLLFDDGRRLVFDDTRKFGRVWLVKDKTEVLHGLGPEPLNPAFTSHDLYQKLVSHHRQLKPLLMDQHFLAGLGNIYTDEALHIAKLHPLVHSDHLSETQAEVLWKAIRQILLEGIDRNGASIDWVYKGGKFQNYFRVYQRTGKPCLNCGTLIMRIVVGQRGTHICPTCQPSPIK